MTEPQFGEGPNLINIFQMNAIQELRDHVQERGHVLDGWDFCDNGCCLMFALKDQDELFWRIDHFGAIELVHAQSSAIVETLQEGVLSELLQELEEEE